jgi:hypothetical protein
VKHIFFGLKEEDKHKIANMLNCKIGALPMPYLGIPIGDYKLRVGDFDYMAEKDFEKDSPIKEETNVIRS